MTSTPKPARFNLQITLGNDAMQTGYDIAEALRQVAATVAAREDPIYGSITDANGNQVGSWHVTEAS